MDGGGPRGARERMLLVIYHCQYPPLLMGVMTPLKIPKKGGKKKMLTERGEGKKGKWFKKGCIKVLLMKKRNIAH